MTYPVNPVGFNPMFQASMPNDYTNPTNFGSYGGGNPSQSGWGLNTSYLTPSFLAPYRPQYAGNANFQMPTMGFGRALNTAIPTPFQPDTPYYANPQMYQARAASEVGNKISDGAMAAGQFVIPVAIGLATAAAVDSFRFSGGAQADVSRMAYGFRSSMPSWLGGAETLTQASYLARSQTLMEAGGHWAGRTAGRAVGAAATAAVQSLSFVVRGRTIGGLPSFAAAGARVAGFAGAAAGSLLAPYAFGEAIAEGVDAAIFSPYVAGRQTSNMVQDSLRGTYTGGLGSPASPLDVTNRNASKIGFELSRTFTNNTSFGMEASADIYSGATAAGLFKGTQFNTTDMKKRMKDVTQSISLMMSVFNDPSTQDAIERLRQLSEGSGLKSVSAISALSAQYRIASAVTGVGTRELMSGVGTQGQLMYAQSGLMPHLGQYAAINAMSGISSAYRSGLVSSTSLAMMGGEQGATQLAVQAQIGLARNPYFEMTAFNKYAGGKNPTDVIGNIAAFGQAISSNPLAGYGKFMLNKDITTSNMLRDDPRSVIDRIVERGKTMPGFYTKEGRIDAASFGAIAMSQGLSVDQIRALYTQIQGEAKYQTSGAASAALETSRAAMLNESNMTYYKGGITGTVTRIPYNTSVIGREVRDYMSESVVGPWNESWSNLTDSFHNAIFGMSNNVGVREESNLYDGAKVVQAMLGDSPAIKSRNYRANKAAYLKGPDDNTVANIAKLDILAKTRNLPSGMSFSNEQLVNIAGEAKISGGKEAAKLALVFRNARKADTKTTNLYKDYTKSASTASTKALMGDAYDNSFMGWATGTDMGVGGVGERGSRKLASLSEPERLALRAFTVRYNSSLTNTDSFLESVVGEPYIQGILTKMGYGRAFSSSGPEADAEAKAAMQVITLAYTVSSMESVSSDSLSRAADMAAGEGPLSAISESKVAELLPEATELVRRSHKSSTDAIATGNLAVRDPDKLIAQRTQALSLQTAAMRSLGSTDKDFDFTMLMQASETQQKAADKLYIAAQMIALSYSGEGDRGSLTSAQKTSMSSLRAEAANIGGR
jgi:hypothetical protein